jgi:hypothetical protein
VFVGIFGGSADSKFDPEPPITAGVHAMLAVQIPATVPTNDCGAVGNTLEHVKTENRPIRLIFCDVLEQRRTAWDSKKAEEAGVEPTEDACAPSNGFEARAPHRERYSSEGKNAAVLPVMKGAIKVAPILRPVPKRRKQCPNVRAPPARPGDGPLAQVVGNLAGKSRNGLLLS